MMMYNSSTVRVLNEDAINDTVWEYLENHLGPQYMPTAIVLPITVVYLLIFISGICGNLIVCLVISRNSHFQTPTNYYLFSLAISDLLILLFGLPNDLKVYWQQYPWELGELVCKLRALIAEMTSYASVLTIVAFTMERYIAICHPLFIQTVSTLPRAIKFITSVWVISCLSAVPFACLTKLNYVDYPLGSGRFVKESAYCGLPMEIQSITRPLLQFATFAFFFLPLTVIIVLYVKISMKLRSTKFTRMTYKTTTSRCSSTTSGCSGENRKTEIRRSVNKMLIAVVIAFFVCWAPFHAQRLLAVYVAPEDWTVELRTVNEILYYAAGCFYYFSATVNPILYTLMSSKYRVAFREALCNIHASKTATNNTSMFRHTQYQQSEMIHLEKEPSVRISKQSFDADTSMKLVSVRPGSNQLSVPGSEKRETFNRSISGVDDPSEDYVFIDRKGEIGDAKAVLHIDRDDSMSNSNGVHNYAHQLSEKTSPKVTRFSKEVLSNSTKKDLVVSLEPSQRIHENFVDGQAVGKTGFFCKDKCKSKNNETCV